jgi:hypothetical protein
MTLAHVEVPVRYKNQHRFYPMIQALWNVMED